MCVCVGRKRPGLLNPDVVILHDNARRTCDLLRHYGWEVLQFLTVRISRPVISISHEATSWQVISSSRFYSGDEALCPVITTIDDCYSLSNVLVTTEIPNPVVGSLSRLFNAEVVALTTRVYPHIVVHGSLLQFIKATNSSSYFCPEMLTTL